MSIIVEETSETEEVTNQTEPQKQEAPKPALPDKFRDKTLEDVVEMYTNLEKEKGRLANEVGEVRGLTDRLLALEEKRLSDLTPETQTEEFRVDAAELLSDPDTVLKKWYDKAVGETSKQYEARLARMESQLALNHTKETYGDVDTIVSSPEFIEFATGNQYRAQIAQAAVNGNPDALNYLLSEFDERRKLTGTTTEGKTEPTDSTPTPAQRGKEALEAARKASLESSSTGDVSSSVKIFKRADLIRLKLEDPDRYEDPAFQEEVVAAYREGRVR